MAPYRLVEQTDTHLTYEYRTAYTWTLYGILFLMIWASWFHPDDALRLVSFAGMFVYFAAKLTLGRTATSHIRRAMQVGTVEISGKRTSFRHPLRIRVPRHLN